ncbi:hypothetical protein RUM43_002239 [Polyplax serrata]|uniref:Uncharacterized protein n=1 Tax=Polyplax serrata TaxID=468196 RepID=A0AAN8PDK2_POLSC
MKWKFINCYRPSVATERAGASPEERYDKACVEEEAETNGGIMDEEGVKGRVLKDRFTLASDYVAHVRPIAKI